MRVMITGGAGLIGYFLSLDLSARGHEVLVFDNFSTFIDPVASNYHFYMSERIRGLGGRVSTVRGDVRDQRQVRLAMRDFGPHVIVHLAAVANAKTFDVCFQEASHINLNGTINCLEALRDAPSARRFVFASSSFVYGDFEASCVDETHPINPKDLYGATKLSGEAITRSFCRRLDIEFAIVRPSSVYGPTDCNRRVSQIFIENALQGRELVLQGGVDNRLDFTYVEDTARGFALAALEERGANQTFNITCGESRTLMEYVEILRQYIPDVMVREEPADPDRPMRGTLDISRARRLLGYQPRFSLEEGLRHYVSYVLERGELLGLSIHARENTPVGR